MQRLIGLAIFSVVFFTAVNVNAAELKGNFQTQVTAGTIIQTNSGTRNTNQLAIGSITGKSSKARGNVYRNAKIGAVIRANNGAFNKNEAAIESLPDNIEINRDSIRERLQPSE